MATFSKTDTDFFYYNGHKLSMEACLYILRVTLLNRSCESFHIKNFGRGEEHEFIQELPLIKVFFNE